MAYCVLRSKYIDKMLRIPINWSVARPRYEIYVIKISVSPEKSKMIFFSNFPQGLKEFPNLFPCA